MCGIAGIVRARPDEPVSEDALRRMARALRHRGPDGFGLARGPGAGFVSTRLAIFDIPGGWQPMLGARGTLLVYNGEVYNHPELRAELGRAGRALRTTSDTEVVHALLERDGLAALPRLNGQFALAWWEPAARRLTLVRDRFGVRPLHWSALPGGGIAFGSEAKALFASGEVEARPDLAGIDEVFTTWGALAPRTAFAGVEQLPPGGVLAWQDGRVARSRWWEPDYAPATAAAGSEPGELAALLEDAVRLRLRADVPVGTYLSGGLDSSLVTALAQRVSDHELRTFSVAFHDARYDERPFQEQVARALGTQHHVVEAGADEIAGAFEDVVWHAETPLIRTAPVPLALLARATRAHGITVVATGEGADELFWGYDLFKETAVRALHAREPERAEALLDALYPYLDGSAARAATGERARGTTGRRGAAWQRFFLGAGDPADQLFSHQPRIAATAGARALLRDEARAKIGDPLARLRAALPDGFGRWSRLERAAYLELTTLLSANLLAAQGDRVAMASGVEGRFPFLDHRVFEHSVRLAPERKLAGLAAAAGELREKAELRELAHRLLPAQIAARPKLPYRAPQVAPFFRDGAPLPWVAERLAPGAIEAAGILDPARVAQLVRRCAQGRARGAREEMAFVGALSAQAWHERFARARYPREDGEPRVALALAAAGSREHAGSAA
jgi:asparagine synthase (glutamine-hydrolysing)